MKHAGFQNTGMPRGRPANPKLHGGKGKRRVFSPTHDQKLEKGGEAESKT